MSEPYNLDGDRQPWLSTPESTECTVEQVWSELRDFIYELNDLPNDDLYDVVTAWILCTWCHEQWSIASYLKALGPKRSGKTRLLNTLYHLCYRAVKSSSIRTSPLFRIVEKWRTTTILDETEQYLHNVEMQNILNSGYKRGDYAIRVLDPVNNELGFYDTFGFKALAGTEELRDTLESRCIVLNMQRNIRPVKFRIDGKKSMELRCKLLYLREHCLNDLNEPNQVPKELEFSDGRFAELFTPLYTMATFATSQSNTVVKYARGLYGSYMSREEVSVEAEVVLAMTKCKPVQTPKRMSTRDITFYFNELRESNERWRVSGVGRIVARLGLLPIRMADGRKGWCYERDKMEKLIRRYNTPIGGELKC